MQYIMSIKHFIHNVIKITDNLWYMNYHIIVFFYTKLSIY